MLEINTLSEFNDRAHELIHSTDALRGMAEKWGELYRAINQSTARTADGRYMLFWLGSREYRMTRWYFRNITALAYPHVNPDRVYATWIRGDGDGTVAECVEVVRAESGTEDDMFDNFLR